jgi:hypothetical protein
LHERCIWLACCKTHWQIHIKWQTEIRPKTEKAIGPPSRHKLPWRKGCRNGLSLEIKISEYAQFRAVFRLKEIEIAAIADD